MKKRNHQQKTELRNKIVPIILFSLILFIFVYIIVFDYVTIYHFENNELNTFTGTYGIQRFSGGKRSSPNYVFALDNGDMVSVLCRHVDFEGDISAFSELTFTYSRMLPLGGFPFTYQVVEIMSPDGDVIVDIEESISRYRNGLKDTLIILGVFVCLSAMLYAVYRLVRKKYKI